MSENPYAQPGPGYTDSATPPDARTSVLAVLSFVSGVAGLVLCCIPVIGLLGVVFGVPALFSISSSRGARRGTGLAVTGVVLGLIGAALGAAIYLGIARGGAWVTQRAEVMTHIEAQDVPQAQAQFVTRVQGDVTAERIAEFRAAYHAELGAYQGTPQSILEFGGLYLEVGQGARDRFGDLGRIYEAALPVAAEFDRQPAIVVAALDPDAGRAPRLLNVGVLLDDGAIIWLLPAPAPQTTPAPAPGPTPGLQEAPEEEGPAQDPAPRDPETGAGRGAGPGAGGG